MSQFDHLSDASDLLAALRRRNLSQAACDEINRIAKSSEPAPSYLIVPGVIKRLIYHSHNLLGRDSAQSVTISLLATKIAAKLSVGMQVSSSDAVRLEAWAWREHTAALLEVGEYNAAKVAAQMSKRFYSLYAALGKTTVARRTDYEEQLLDLVYGQVLFHLGDEGSGMQKVADAGEYLDVVLGKKHKAVQARTIYAGLLMHAEKYGDALEVLEGAAEDAERLGDKETLTYILNNVGRCAAKLGDFERAQQCQELALRHFERLGLKGELPRTRGVLVEILISRGLYDDAISEIYKCRDEYLELNMPVIAAKFNLNVLNVLFTAQRRGQVPGFCAEMLKTFARVGLHKEAMRALAYINDLAGRDYLAPEDVSYVSIFMDRLARDGSIAFPEISRQ
jgi:tetratricopeptide (TPR) repeat protein